MLKGKLNLITDQVSYTFAFSYSQTTLISPDCFQINKNFAEAHKTSSAKVVYHESSSDDEDEKESSVDSDVEEMEQLNLLGK